MRARLLDVGALALLRLFKQGCVWLPPSQVRRQCQVSWWMQKGTATDALLREHQTHIARLAALELPLAARASPEGALVVCKHNGALSKARESQAARTEAMPHAGTACRQRKGCADSSATRTSSLGHDEPRTGAIPARHCCSCSIGAAQWPNHDWDPGGDARHEAAARIRRELFHLLVHLTPCRMGKPLHDSELPDQLLFRFLHFRGC